MAQDTNSLKKLSLLGLAVLAILFIGGIVAWQERLFFCDASYIAYNILKYNRLFIQEHRYGSFITQMVPWLGGKLHLPIGIILKGYAFSFNLFYLLVGIVVYRCRQYGLLLLMAMAYTLLVSDTYFWTNNEIQQALAWMFLFFAVVLYMGQRKASPYLLFPVFVVLAALTIYTHFIVIIPMAFLWGYFWIAQDGWPWGRATSVALTACLGAIVASKFFIVEGISYDAQHLHNVTHFSLHDVLAAAKAAVVKKFVKRMALIYWAALLVFAAGLLALAKGKNKWLLLWVLASFTGYVVIMGLTYTDANGGGDIFLFHIESEWASMAIVMAAPFVYLALPRLPLKQAALLLCAVFLVRFCYIAASAPKFAWRTHFKERVLAQMQQKNITKLGIIITGDIRKNYILDWAMPEESLLMSAMHNEVPQRTFCLLDSWDSTLKSAMSVPGKVQFYYEPAVKGSIMASYFMQDSSHPYTFMTYEELMK
jgi:hypothetical protein